MASSRILDSAGGVDTSTSRAALLEELRRTATPMTVQELADRLTLHPNSIRFHLARLAREGLVREEQASPTGPGRPRLVYSPAAPAHPHPDGYELLAEALSEHLARTTARPDEMAVQAGEQQAHRIMDRPPGATGATADQARQALTQFMGEYGFDPEWDEDGARLWLRNCPFRQQVDHQPEVICSVHLGLLRGALDAVDAPLLVEALHPAPVHHPCLAVLRPRPEPHG